MKQQRETHWTEEIIKRICHETHTNLPYHKIFAFAIFRCEEQTKTSRIGFSALVNLYIYIDMIIEIAIIKIMIISNVMVTWMNDWNRIEKRDEEKKLFRFILTNWKSGEDFHWWRDICYAIYKERERKKDSPNLEIESGISSLIYYIYILHST